MEVVSGPFLFFLLSCYRTSTYVRTYKVLSTKVVAIAIAFGMEKYELT
jgi:hypothetical protein